MDIKPLHDWLDEVGASIGAAPVKDSDSNATLVVALLDLCTAICWSG